MPKIVQHRVLLQYPKAGEPLDNHNLTHPSDAEKFVAIDGPSGGYPFSVAIDCAEDFKTEEKANRYITVMRSKFVVRHVVVTYEFEE